MIISFDHKDLEEVLMEPKATGIKEPYFIIKSEDQNIIILNPGKNGIEYNKTPGYFRKDNSVGMYQCLYGQGILIMQRNDENGEAKEFKVLTIQSGRQIIVPAGFIHTFINIGKGYLIILDNNSYDPRNQKEESLAEKRGLAYYIVEKKGEIAFEQNPNYLVRPQISTE